MFLGSCRQLLPQMRHLTRPCVVCSNNPLYCNRNLRIKKLLHEAMPTGSELLRNSSLSRLRRIHPMKPCRQVQNCFAILHCRGFAVYKPCRQVQNCFAILQILHCRGFAVYIQKQTQLHVCVHTAAGFVFVCAWLHLRAIYAQKSTAPARLCVSKNDAFSASSGARTLDTLIKSQVLFQLS